MSEQDKTNRRNIVIGLLFGVMLCFVLFFSISNASKSSSYTPPMDIHELEQRYHIDIINEQGMPFEPENGTYIIQAYHEGDTTHLRTYYAKVTGTSAILFTKDSFGYPELLN